jgi:uncharacterized cupredoxin-like copper-binding protein
VADVPVRPRVRGWLVVAAATLAILATGGAAALAAGARDEARTIAIRYSSFGPDRLEAIVGRPLTIRLRNDDPIDHEWIVGDDALHARHRSGTEPVHASRPTEVTIPAGETRTTTVVFDRPGTYRFVCHLPGHEAYGMVGTVVVRP